MKRQGTGIINHWLAKKVDEQLSGRQLGRVVVPNSIPTKYTVGRFLAYLA